MTHSEEVAIRWLVKHVNTLTCGHCGGRWLVAKSSLAVLFHRCTPPRSGYDWRPPRQRHDEERESWATETFGALAKAVDDTELLRRLEEE